MQPSQAAADAFDDIRPYHDGEVEGVIHELTGDPEFTGFMGTWLAPPMVYRACAPVVRSLIRLYLRRVLKGIASVRTFQLSEADYARKLVEEGTSSISYDGFAGLRPDQSYLFVSNHRDIAGDSLFLNYALYLHGMDTVRIAIGDNLVQKRFATDIMRLNKGFFIKRSAAGPRKTYAALLQSSQYIRHSLDEGESVWIAQSEGRAKDGLDTTDPAIVKMFLLAERKQPIAQALERLRILPLSISYEFDPCDQIKAREQYLLGSDGAYEKPEGEDLLSLVRGLGDQKGRVMLRLGEPLQGDYESPEAVAAEIDRQIVSRLELFPVNYWAVTQLGEMPYQPLHAEAATILKDTDTSALAARFAAAPPDHLPYLLKMYANPVLNRQKQFVKRSRRRSPHPQSPHSQSPHSQSLPP